MQTDTQTYRHTNVCVKGVIEACFKLGVPDSTARDTFILRYSLEIISESSRVAHVEGTMVLYGHNPGSETQFNSVI
jgi:hypothetical protein